MLKALMQEGKERGISRFTLEVRVSNHPASVCMRRWGLNLRESAEIFTVSPQRTD